MHPRVSPPCTPAVFSVAVFSVWHALAGRLVIGVARGSAAPLDLDQVTLQPGAWGRYQGLPVRRDLGLLMAAPASRVDGHSSTRAAVSASGGGGGEEGDDAGMGLTALRLGGSMVLTPGYRWKNFRGPRETREPYSGEQC